MHLPFEGGLAKRCITAEPCRYHGGYALLRGSSQSRCAALFHGAYRELLDSFGGG